MTNSFSQRISLTEVEQFIKDAKSKYWGSSSNPYPFITTGERILSSIECDSAVPAVVRYAGYLYLKVKVEQLAYNRDCNSYCVGSLDERNKEICQRMFLFEKVLELDSSYLQDKDALEDVGRIRLAIYEV